MTHIALVLLLATAAVAQDSTLVVTPSCPMLEYVPAIVDTDRRHFRELLVREWREYQQACDQDSFLVPTGFATHHPDTVNVDLLGHSFMFTTTPDSAWVHWDRHSFPQFMLWMERSAK